MSRGVVLSKTRYGKKFCYSLLDLDTMQEVRPHWEVEGRPHEFTMGTRVGMVHHSEIKPYSVFVYNISDNPLFTPRITHPEDRLLRPPFIFKQMMERKHFIRIIRSHHTSSSFQRLFPLARCAKSYQWTTTSDIPNPFSAGYLIAQKGLISYSEFQGKTQLRIQATMLCGTKVNAAMVDDEMNLIFEQQDPSHTITFEDALVRFSLTKPYTNTESRESLCYLQCSRIEN